MDTNVAKPCAQVVQLLLANGADRDAATRHRRTALFTAAEMGDLQLVQADETPALGVSQAWVFNLSRVCLKKGEPENGEFPFYNHKAKRTPKTTHPGCFSKVGGNPLLVVGFLLSFL